MPFRDDDLALSLRVDSLREEVESAKAQLDAEDAANAPPRWVAWLLRPQRVILFSIVGSILLLPAGRALHRRAMDEVRPARIRETMFAAASSLTSQCVGVDRYAEIELTFTVDEDGALTESSSTSRAWSRNDRRPLQADAFEIERCVAEHLPQSFGAGSHPIETSVNLRLLARKDPP